MSKRIYQRPRDDGNNKNEERFAKVDKQRFVITEVTQMEYIIPAASTIVVAKL